MLYSKLGRPALGKTMNLVNRSAAEEILQDVFTKLWDKKMVFPNLKSAYAWVYKCCTNGAIDYLRNSNNTNLSLENSTEEAGANNIETKTEANQMWAKVVKILSPDEAALFVYQSLEGLTQDEAAEVMHISRRTVIRLHEKLEIKLEKIRRRSHVG